MTWRTRAQQVLIDGASREDGGGVMGLFFVGGSGVVVRMALGGRNECGLGEFFVLRLAYGFLPLRNDAPVASPCTCLSPLSVLPEWVFITIFRAEV